MSRRERLRVIVSCLLPMAAAVGTAGCSASTNLAVEDTGSDRPPDAPTLSRDFHAQVAMRDGVRLDARVLLPPEGSGPWPTLLLRSPYLGGGSDGHVSIFGGFLDRGYALVLQACRGTGDSEGALEPLVQEFPDGGDTVDWLVAQSWSNGRVGTFGGSYEGFTAGAAAVANPAVDVVVMDGAITRAFAGWPGRRGVPRALGMLWWWTQVQGRPDPATSPEFSRLITNTRPIAGHDIAYLGDEVRVWRELVPHLDGDSTFWDERSLVGRIGRSCVPMLHLQAAQEWDDDPLAAFLDSQGSGCSAEERAAQRFILGSHSHAGAVYDPMSATPSSTLLRMYFDRYLKDEPVEIEAVPRVQYYLTGASAWGEAATWPPGESRLELFLSTDTLVSSVPPAGAGELRLDPENDDPCALDYAKYLTFVSEPLESDVDLVGGAEVHLSVEIDAPDADVFVNLLTLSPANEASWVHGSVVRLRYRRSPDAPTPMTPAMAEQVSLELPAVATRLPAGHRLALSLSGAECGTSENPHTGGPVAEESEARPVSIRVHSGGASPSFVRLPVVTAR
ncbi:MAG: CocE/NonD family hydrolase [Deltaproteobacteria bacterium]|jgi:predicted acyl esterase